ncbi:diacylglycerol/lipid kinase family protein [Arthrobacter sp. NA-172]|uniref:diacylglycerol/lipid kinase family protein n=1 Tax=Arthrobacter sp. NA-172 TaxID=3367524 RepID=UPI00375425FE
MHENDGGPVFSSRNPTRASAARCLRAAGTDVVVLRRDSMDALREAVDEALRPGVDALVVVGGDGMVNLGVNLLAGTGLPLGIVPVGTGNDAARMLGLPLQDVAGSCARVISALADGGRVLDAICSRFQVPSVCWRD